MQCSGLKKNENNFCHSEKGENLVEYHANQLLF